ncbi:MAG: DUF502 domain-containing protein [Hymenobacteraceae bacterium]|nr:DUF502 domain-containing protein [Hymenobacteraceae bacterium]
MFVRFFLRGLLILAPATLTVYLAVGLVRGLNSTFDLGVPGLGILLVVVAVALTGWVGSAVVVRPLLALTERIIHRMPLVGIVYTSLRDLFDAFVGDNQKFNEPVIVKLTEDSESYKIGFVTQPTLTMFGLPDMASVYFPDSYNFSGELLLVPRRHITPLAVPSAEVMKFIVSGGVANVLSGKKPAPVSTVRLSD